jgi:hypothetical protein
MMIARLFEDIYNQNHNLYEGYIKVSYIFEVIVD